MLLDSIVQGMGFCLGAAIMALVLMTVLTFVAMIVQKYEE